MYIHVVSPRGLEITQHTLVMTNKVLKFEPTIYKKSDGTEVVFQVNDSTRIDMIITELQAIYAREQKRDLMALHLPYEAPELLLEAIGLLEKATEWGEPTDDDLCGEPPLTMAELHSAAWKEHQEAHR